MLRYFRYRPIQIIWIFLPRKTNPINFPNKRMFENIIFVQMHSFSILFFSTYTKISIHWTVKMCRKMWITSFVMQAMTCAALYQILEVNIRIVYLKRLKEHFIYNTYTQKNAYVKCIHWIPESRVWPADSTGEEKILFCPCFFANILVIKSIKALETGEYTTWWRLQK